MGQDPKYQIYAATGKSLIMYSCDKNKHEKLNIFSLVEPIKDFTVAYNHILNKEYIVIAYPRRVTLIVGNQVANHEVETDSDIQRIWVFWMETYMQVVFQTNSDSEKTISNVFLSL